MAQAPARPRLWASTPTPAQSESKPMTLYEGNFSEWIPEMIETIKSHNFSYFSYEISATSDITTGRIEIYSTKAREEILSRVNPRLCAILETLSADVPNAVYALLKYAKTYSQPFRFLALSAELRNMIYTRYFEAEGKPCIYPPALSSPDNRYAFRRALPHLLRANSQVRSEAFEIYLSATPIEFYVGTDYVLHKGTNNTFISSIVQGWKHAVVGDRMKAVRQLDLVIRERTTGGASCAISLRADKEGFAITYPEAGLSGYTKKRLQAAEADLKKTAGAEGLKGEAIITILVKRKALWAVVVQELLYST